MTPTFPPPPEEPAEHGDPHPSSIGQELDDEWPDDDE